jgi:hypothetical protein
VRQQQQQVTASPSANSPSCWLRKRRSQTDLSTASAGGSSTTLDMAWRLPTSQSITSLPMLEQQQQVQTIKRQVSAAVHSMWDHALLEPDEARRCVDAGLARAEASADPPATAPAPAAAVAAKQSESSGGPASGACRAGSGWEAWQWDEALFRRRDVVPAAFAEVAHFAAFESGREGGGAADITCAVEFEEHGWLVATAGMTKQVGVGLGVERGRLLRKGEGVYCLDIRVWGRAARGAGWR